MNRQSINIIYNSNDDVALLSNLAHAPFTLDGIPFASVEGLIQGLKCENPEKQKRIFLRFGFEAKRAGTRKRNQKIWRLKTVWWQKNPIAFQSDEHYELIYRGLKAKFKSNKNARDILLETKGADLIHDLGKPEPPRTSLPGDIFISMLMKIRQEI